MSKTGLLLNLLKRRWDSELMKEHKGFKKIDFTFEGNSYEAKKGDSIAAALTSNNIKIFRSTESNTKDRKSVV